MKRQQYESLACVDVVIPVYNGSRWLRCAVESALAQTGILVTVYIVDDGSTDGSRIIAEALKQEDSRVHVINIPHSGLSAARNQGISVSKNEWVALLDCDDSWLSTKCADQTALCTSEVTDWCVADAFVVDENLQLIGKLQAPKRLLLNNLLRENCVPSPSGVLIRRSLLEHVGDFDERLVAAEDWDMWIRLASEAKPSCLRVPVVNYTVHDANMSKDIEKMFTATVCVLNKHRNLYSGPFMFHRAMARNSVRIGIEAIAAGRVKDAMRLALHGFKVFPPARGTVSLLRWSLKRLVGISRDSD